MNFLKKPKLFLLLLVLLNLSSLALPLFIDSGELATAADGSTAVEVQVVSASGDPVPQAQVSLSNPAVSGTTDAQGFVRLANLTAPDKSPVDVTVTATGFNGWTLQGAYLLTADTLKVRAELTALAPGQTGPPQVVQSPTPRWLLSGSADQGPTPGPANPTPRVTTNYADRNPPASIRVFRVSLNQVDTVPFDFYVKHVLPSEWIPSWQAESLKAGAMAAKTYGWYWTNFAKYPGQGYDVRDDYADQAYNPNVSYSSTDNAVDAVASWRMTRSSAIFQAHFCAGVEGDGSRTDTHCGNTPGNWLSQWGSQYWAQQGQNFNWILTYYYDNIALTQDVGQPEVVVDNSDSTFTANYTQRAWQTGSSCSSVNGSFLYIGNTPTLVADHNEAYWRPSLPQAGYYDVWANIPACSATTTNARYQVHYSGNNTVTVPINQLNVSGFTKLGNWLFNADSSSYVYLDNVTGESLNSTRVGVDALKFVYTGAPAVTLSSISVSPPSATIEQGTTRQFTATGNYSNGSTADLTNSVSWSTSNSNIATINSTGLASGFGPGTATIYAAKDGKTGSASLTVQQPVVLTGITVAPASVTIAFGATQQFTATGNYSNGTTADITSSVTWNSNNTDIATVSATGLATGKGIGNASISATKDGKSGSALLTVSPPTVGQGSVYAAVFVDAYNRRGGQPAFGYPNDIVKQYGSSGVYWQPLGGGSLGAGAIFFHQAGGADPTAIRAYTISGASYTAYLNNGGLGSSFGPPTTDEFVNAAGNKQVNFANGYFASTGGSYSFTPWPSAFDAWKNSYFNNAQLYSGPSLVQNDGVSGSPNLSLNWGSNQAPQPQQGLNFTTNWSARWERSYSFAAGYYKFELCGDDGVRLYLNNNMVINQWRAQGYTCFQYIAGYSATTSVPLKIEYFQGSGGALLDFTVTPVTPTVVTKSVDDGGAGSLSNILTNATNTTVITFGAGVSTISFSGVATVPPVKPGVTILGTCGPSGPNVTIDGTGIAGDGLTLQGGNQVSGLWLKNFGGRQLVTPGKQLLFVQSCVKVTEK